MSQAVLDPIEVLELWPRLTAEERATAREPIMAIADPVWWMRHGTKTVDEQDHVDPYKPFPDYPYFDKLYELWLTEPILFVEKSRTMMLTWFFSALCLHWAMTHQPSKVIFWAQDEDRALKPLEYCWTMWEQMTPRLKALWPLDRPRDRQGYNMLELARGGALLALPGKDPDKIRSEHPSIVMLDEAAFIDKGREAVAVALATRVPKLVALTSANPGWFRSVTKDAQPASWPRRAS